MRRSYFDIWLTAVMLSACAQTVDYSVVKDGQGLTNQELMTQPYDRLPSDTAVKAQKEIIAAQTTKLDSKVELLHSELPEYPREVQLAGIQGVVSVEVIVDESGSVEATKVIESPDPRLSASSVAAIRKWRFAPVSFHGKPTKIRFIQRFPFRLQ